MTESGEFTPYVVYPRRAGAREIPVVRPEPGDGAGDAAAAGVA